MRKRGALARAMVLDPEIFFFDEPCFKMPQMG